MNLFLNMFNITPIILVLCVVLVIIAMSIKNEKVSKIMFGIGIIVAFTYTFILMGIVVPYIFLSGMFENGSGLILMISIILAVWFVVSIFINLKNNLSFLSNKVKSVYIRDVDVEYSPAVVSYLMNNKIETKKDLSATLLNLCAKNILKIEKTEDNKVNIVDLGNQKEIGKLKSDEEYAYKMFISGITNSKINSWKNKVKDEYTKYRFSKAHERSLGMYIFGLYVAIFIGIFLYFIISGENEITGKVAKVMSSVLIATFIGAWEMLLFSGAKEIINSIVNRNNKNEFRDTYTSKGAREYTRWKNFEKFIEHFSLINQKEHDSVILWGKYLSYSIALGINKKCDSELYKRIDKAYYFDYNIFVDMFEEYKE